MNGTGNEWTFLYLILGMNLIVFLGVIEFLRQLVKVIGKISRDVVMLEATLDSISSEVSDINLGLREIALGQEPPDDPME